MNNKWLLTALVIFLAIFLMGSAPSDGIMHDPPNPPTPKAVIVNNETGKSYDLPVVTHWVKNLGNGKHEAKISVDIPEEVLSRSLTAEISTVDSEGAARIYVHITYSCYYEGQQYMKLSKVKGKWVQLDGRVSCTTLRVAARCYGGFYSSGFCNRYNWGDVSYPSSGSYYYIIPYWSNEYVTITYLGYSQTGIVTAYLKRGTSTWNATISLGNSCLW